MAADGYAATVYSYSGAVPCRSSLAVEPIAYLNARPALGFSPPLDIRMRAHPLRVPLVRSWIGIPPI